MRSDGHAPVFVPASQLPPNSSRSIERERETDAANLLLDVFQRFLEMLIDGVGDAAGGRLVDDQCPLTLSIAPLQLLRRRRRLDVLYLAVFARIAAAAVGRLRPGGGR